MQPNKNEFVCECCYLLEFGKRELKGGGMGWKRVKKEEFYNKQLSNQTTIMELFLDICVPTLIPFLQEKSKDTF